MALSRGFTEPAVPVNHPNSLAGPMSKWADYLVSAVRYDADGTAIAKLEVREDEGENVGSAETWTRAEVVGQIEKGTSFATIRRKDNQWARGEDIHVITVDGTKYLRTDRNRTAADNLGSLPEF